MQNCFICNGQASSASFARAAVSLQQAFIRSRCTFVMGADGGWWEALWLAEQYNVRALILTGEGESAPRTFRRAALRNAYAVICPVYVCVPPDARLPHLPNANILYCKPEIPDFANEL